MSYRDTVLLTDGFGLGAYTVLLVVLICGLVQDRRDRKARLAAGAKLAAARRRAVEPSLADIYANPDLVGKADPS